MGLGQDKDRITDRREGNSVQDFLARQNIRDNTPEKPRPRREIKEEQRQAVTERDELAQDQFERNQAELTGLVDFTIPHLNEKVRELQQLMDTANENLDILFKKNNEVVDEWYPAPPDAGDTFPWDQCSFGWSVSGSDITIYEGRFMWTQKRYSATQQVFTITEDPSFIQLRLDWAKAIADRSTIATIINSGSTEEESDDDYFYHTLYEVPLKAGGSNIDTLAIKIRSFLDFTIPGYMAPGS